MSNEINLIFSNFAKYKYYIAYSRTSFSQFLPHFNFHSLFTKSTMCTMSFKLQQKRERRIMKMKVSKEKRKTKRKKKGTKRGVNEAESFS